MKISLNFEETKETKQPKAKGQNPIKNAAASLLSGIKNTRLAPLERDIFTPKIMRLDMPGPHGRKDLEGKVVKNIKLKDAAGKKVQGYILESTKTLDEYFVATKDEVLCRMKISDFGDSLSVNALYGQANNGKYKGAGTELLKFAVQKSKDAGKGGRLELTVGGSPRFYYKNNFRQTPHSKNYLRENAVLDFITRQDINIDNVWGKFWNTPYVVLEEKEAEALLHGKRLYEESHSEYMGEFEIEYEHKGEPRKMTVGIDFADLSNYTVTEGVFVVQAYSKSVNETKFGTNVEMHPLANIEMRLLEDENGEKYLQIDTVNESWKGEKAVTKELMKVVEAKMDELGAKYIKKNGAKDKDFL